MTPAAPKYSILSDSGKHLLKLVERMDRPKLLRVKVRMSIADYLIDSSNNAFLVPRCVDERSWRASSYMGTFGIS